MVIVGLVWLFTTWNRLYDPVDPSYQQYLSNATFDLPPAGTNYTALTECGYLAKTGGSPYVHTLVYKPRGSYGEGAICVHMRGPAWAHLRTRGV